MRVQAYKGLKSWCQGKGNNCGDIKSLAGTNCLAVQIVCGYRNTTSTTLKRWCWGKENEVFGVLGQRVGGEGERIKDTPFNPEFFSIACRN